MKTIKKILSFSIIIVLLLQSFENAVYAISNTSTNKVINAAVFLNNINDIYISNFKRSLENVEKEHSNVKFTFFDSEGNQTTANENISKALYEGFNLFVVIPTSSNAGDFKDILNRISQANIPLILFLPTSSELAKIVRTFPRSVIIDTDVVQSGLLQGKILAQAWKSHKETIDKNKDNILQYIILQGPSNNMTATARTKYSIQALNEAGINTQQLLSIVCNWQIDCAEKAIESAFLKYGDKIEAIISNNDDMAIGAVKALQKYGFNKGGDSKSIPVLGIDGLPEAIELINQSYMLGTVVEDIQAEANAIYDVGMNLISGNNPLSGTNYQFDETGITIKIPFHEYSKLLKFNLDNIVH